ncbi:MULTISPECIES: hypothetical protein [Polynucleobacter]|jgi:hypothetical protein|uniref:Uncharacterized protein n=2 Tax=Polynucleobacter TaxID=44013 RepID=A0A191UGY2_9BURK|nr:MULTISPECIES: hypothetical protein [Polynucleobacter]ANJ00238.1 hypothetical protein A8O14_09190 [Polynucleobacter wuianus]MBU3553861.1 hypothetical protein [Polynucleobacter sp. MWH-Post4-6-1]MDF9789210.1 hypothetical protein [Polynucleobacter sphagniphilus]MDH6155854.1 hypothetical protein [Polynucleobacter sphagniphilus]MDH6242331.1 hypothetical protein [Polynucleobacter sphagniphilus]
MSNKSYVIAVNMIPYGIKMVVKSTTDFVDAIVNEFERLVNSDHEKADGYHLVLKAKLLREDAFFNKHPKAAHVQKERWGKFCDLCVDFAALNTVLYKEPIYLVHPEQFDEQRARGLLDLSSAGGVDLIPEVPVMRLAA